MLVLRLRCIHWCDLRLVRSRRQGRRDRVRWRSTNLTMLDIQQSNNRDRHYTFSAQTRTTASTVTAISTATTAAGPTITLFTINYRNLPDHHNCYHNFVIGISGLLIGETDNYKTVNSSTLPPDKIQCMIRFLFKNWRLSSTSPPCEKKSKPRCVRPQ